MKHLEFYKENDGRWFVDLPDWKGPKADLEMVCGADALLDQLSNDKDKVGCQVSEIPIENFELLEFIREGDESQSGAFYHTGTLFGQQAQMEIWLCDVTKFVFGYFPRRIYLNVLD